MNDNYPPGVSDSDINKHFGESTNPNEYRYVNQSTSSEQEAICRDYLDYASGWDRYNEACDDDPIGVVDYCEKLDSFWEWIRGE